MSRRYGPLFDNPTARGVFINAVKLSGGAEQLSDAALKVIDFSQGKMARFVVYAFTVRKDDVHYSDLIIGKELCANLPRTAIVVYDPDTQQVYPTFALKKLMPSSPATLKSKVNEIAKIKISRKVNGKPCSLQKVVSDGLTYIVFVQKTVLVYVLMSDLYAFRTALDAQDDITSRNEILNKFTDTHFGMHAQLKELFEVIYVNLEKYIGLLNLLGKRCVVTGELDDGRHIEIPTGPKKFVLHTAMDGLSPIDFSIIEKYCCTNGLNCVTYETIELTRPDGQTSSVSKLHELCSVLMAHYKRYLNSDIEGWVVTVLDENGEVIMALKLKKLPYVAYRTLRELVRCGKDKTRVSEDDYARFIKKFQHIFTFDHNKSRYFGLTKKGQKSWLDWLENQFVPYAKKYVSVEGDPMKPDDVSINTNYGKMNGYGWFLGQLMKLGMRPFTLEENDVDFSVDAFINNIFEDDRTDSIDNPSDTVSNIEKSKANNKAIYFCFQIDHTQFTDPLGKLDLSGFPENATFKITEGESSMILWVCASSSDKKTSDYLSGGMSSLLGKTFDVVVKSFSRDAAFGRLDIDLPDELMPFYKNEVPAHVAVVHTGKASRAGTFEATQVIPLGFTIRGTVLVAIQGNRLVNSLA
jgi:hypothetical protein